MRFVIAAAALATVLFGAAAAQAEKRVFIIANNADGYGVDRCLASGDNAARRWRILLQVARVRAGAVVQQSRPRRHHRRHSVERPGLCTAEPATTSSPSSARASFFDHV